MKLWIEANKKYLREEYNNNIKKYIETENFYCWWYQEKIQKAFNFGKGTMKDFERYMNDNKCYCIFKEIEVPDDEYRSIMHQHNKF